MRDGLIKNSVVEKKEDIEAINQILRSPCCKVELLKKGKYFCCTNCGKSFPILGSIPVLIDSEKSLFTVSGYSEVDVNFKASSKSSFFGLIFPSPTLNIHANKRYAYLGKLIERMPGTPVVLIVGGANFGTGLSHLRCKKEFILLESDVTFGTRTQIISDAHDIPLGNGSVDAVIIQAVLEHVLDPNKCVAEIHRVLKTDGIVYSETPFLQHVHEGQYDFTRFTHLGHRYLFRDFSEIQSGAIGGPGSVLAWSYEYFLLSFAGGGKWRSLVKIFARLTGFWLKYLDLIAPDRKGVYDSASGYYFLGKREDTAADGKEIISNYRGLQSIRKQDDERTTTGN